MMIVMVIIVQGMVSSSSHRDWDYTHTKHCIIKGGRIGFHGSDSDWLGGRWQNEQVWNV